MDELQKYELESLLEELEGYRGKHTELITALIPAGASLIHTKRLLEEEKGTASNIKSSTTRKNVINALDLAVRRLQEIKTTPENGLAVFSGLVTMEDGRESLESWVVEPPRVLKTKTYRCDQTFVLGPLRNMLDSDEVYGLLIIELNEASIGILDGNNIKLLKHIFSGVPGKHKTGGQSAQRFERIRDSKSKEFYKKTAEHMKRLFWDNKKLKGIFIGGGGPAKEHFMKQSQLVTQLKNKVIALKNMGGDGIEGLHELVGLCQIDLEEQEITKQRVIIDLFLEKLGKEPNNVSYGEAEVKDRLNKGAVEKLILLKSLPREKIKDFKRLAEASSTEVHIVGDETPRGIQFKSLGGFGGILRFEVHD